MLLLAISMFVERPELSIVLPLVVVISTAIVIVGANYVSYVLRSILRELTELPCEARFVDCSKSVHVAIVVAL